MESKKICTCSHCSEVIINPFPCLKCGVVVYCSQKCFDSDQEDHTRICGQVGSDLLLLQNNFQRDWSNVSITDRLHLAKLVPHGKCAFVDYTPEVSGDALEFSIVDCEELRRNPSFLENKSVLDNFNKATDNPKIIPVVALVHKDLQNGVFLTVIVTYPRH